MIAGIDFGLTRLAGDEYAQAWQLATEYNPAPPFAAGTPEQADPLIRREVLRVLGPRAAHVRDALVGTPGYVDG